MKSEEITRYLESQGITEADLILDDGASSINPLLIVQQKLTLAQVMELRELHRRKDEIFQRAHADMKTLEFVMQDVWGFERDESKHTHRHRIPNPQHKRNKLVVKNVKSCDFCNGPVDRHAFGVDPETATTRYFECTKCGALGDPLLGIMHNLPIKETHNETNTNN